MSRSDYSDLFRLKSHYFNAAYLGPTPLRTQAAINALVEKSLDPSQLGGQFDLHDEVRARWAKLLDCESDNVAVSTSVSELVSHVANGLDLSAKDEVVLMEGDYPSLVLPWMVNAEHRGFQVRRLSRADFLDPSRFAEQLRANTRFAGCSHVMFNTGIRLPIAELGQAARQAGCLFLADTSQSFGGMPIARDILHNVDILIGVGYKWILGPYGSAYGYFSPAAQQRLRRTHASWLQMPGAQSRENLLNYTTACVPGARKFDRGEASSYLISVALKASLDLLLEIGLDKIAEHNSALTNHFLHQLPPHVEVVSDRQPKRLSNIVCIRPDNATQMHQTLAGQNIQVSIREGTVRFAFHLYNTKLEIEKVAATFW